MAVAVFKSRSVVGEAIAESDNADVLLRVKFTKLPEGKHGFHIHKAGDLRGEGCKGACAHWHVGKPASHGGLKSRTRHTGDLGNVAITRKRRIFRRTYRLAGVQPTDLWGLGLSNPLKLVGWIALIAPLAVSNLSGLETASGDVL